MDGGRGASEPVLSFRCGELAMRACEVFLYVRCGNADEPALYGLANDSGPTIWPPRQRLTFRFRCRVRLMRLSAAFVVDRDRPSDTILK